MTEPYNVLFLCTGNSARSILAEALMSHRGAGRFRSFSAGSHPTGRVNPLALRVLADMGLPADGYRSKSWDEFGQPGAPAMHFVFTVCDNAAGEVCPLWIGDPIKGHWGVPDPAAVDGDEETRIQAFRDALARLDTRISAFAALPIDTLDRAALQRKVSAIGIS